MERTVEASAPGLGVAPPDERTTSKLDFRLVAAIGAVWIFWGSTFAGMRAAVASMPPFAMTSMRFTIAGLILWAICAVRGKGKPTRDDLVRATITGATLLLFGNGMTAWTVQFLPTGMNSILLSLAPAWMAIIAFIWYRERPTRLAVAGMVLGFGGLVLLVRPTGSASLPLWPAILAVLASASWAFGSVYQRRAGPTSSLVRTTALQMIVGGILLGIEAALFGEWSFDLRAVTATSWLGFGWLIVFGSLISYSAYLYTMRTASTALASTYAYVNPVVSVILGMLLFHERFTPIEAVASAVILAGVVLMMIPKRIKVEAA